MADHGEDIEVLASEIIKKVYAHPDYAHAENILHRLRELEIEYGRKQAIVILHQEVIE